MVCAWPKLTLFLHDVHTAALWKDSLSRIISVLILRPRSLIDDCDFSLFKGPVA